MSKIYGNMIGGAGLAQTYILEDLDGNQIVATVGNEPISLDATSNDIREGKIAATDSGVTVGDKVIPSYHTVESSRLVEPGENFSIPLSILNLYDYTKLQAIICLYNTSMEDSVYAEKISINDNVYPVQSTEYITTVEKDSENKSINLGFTNDTENSYVIRYFTYKEVI